MADETQLAIIRQQDRNAWAQWRSLNQYTNIDLSGADLTGLDLSDYYLARANLKGTRLKGTVLRRADLQAADLSKTDLREADLRDTKGMEAKFVSATLDDADLSGANLERADFTSCILKTASLQSSNLRAAKLVGADLENGVLRGTNFERADLRRALLKGTDATKGQFDGAKLFDAQLTGANLEGANLLGAEGLVQSQLAGTDLRHVQLDGHLKDFHELDRVAQIATYGRRVFSILLLLCIFSLLVIVQAMDKALAVNSTETTLPLIQAKVPLASLFYFMPALLATVFVYFHVNLQELWKGLASLPAVFPDGEILPRRAFPWIMTSLVYICVEHLKHRRPAYWSWNVVITVVGAWFVTPGMVIWFFDKSVRLSDFAGTCWLIFLSSLIVGFAVDSGVQTRSTFSEAGMRSTASGATGSRRHAVAKRLAPFLVAFLAALVWAWYRS